MDQHHGATLSAAAGVTERRITIGGREWRLAAPRLIDFAAVEAELLGRLPSPIHEAVRFAANVPPSQVETYWRLAFEATARMHHSVWERLARMPVGLQLGALAMLFLRRHHGAEIRTLDDAIQWVEMASTEAPTEVNAAFAFMQAELEAVGKNPPIPRV